MTAHLTAIKRGYAYVEMNERGHFFSEGNYDILGAPLSDGDDAITWMSTQPWSNGKVGTIGCSSTAEWQLGVASLGNKGFAAMIPQGFGAGVGRVAPYFEQGNWYRGGAVQMLFHRMDLWAAEPGASDVPTEHLAGRSDSRLESVRPGAAASAGGLVESVAASA
jgi:predicted acyl esterase